MKKERFYGFMLIKLLVVIAIIAILAAILFPVFAQAREKARQTACMNNMKQLGLAIIQYVEDWDEYYPFCWIESPPSYSDNWGGIKFREILYPYTKNNGIFRCPSQKGDGLTNFRTGCAHFGVNRNVCGIYWGPESLQPPWSEQVNIAQVVVPAQTIVTADADFTSLPPYTWPGEYIGGSTGASWTNWLPPAYYLRVHSGGTNVVWADGHAKWLRVEAMTCFPQD